MLSKMLSCYHQMVAFVFYPAFMSPNVQSPNVTSCPVVSDRHLGRLKYLDWN